ncbi:endoribonuclease L-PSP domain-containing protein [Cavenderia fasciculata]|uniref:Diphthine--ammonia ligase n=1 Tax=Cavenderia fasciculata TaxID=261658 RepID=F4PR87_CACFS|nr:endoribonuclease L-PSP domain-containing protein [Cavenderia fasciculata]EGG21287.1 endoribonuclease L-PSP domain-containing protein [Cavenderia fasciculata]|eukprot:XP_004359137.1 endoribonuclease L-PSP domain-containing protein [Cavenderia fasciculata]
MKLVGLISGGKDSIYNLIECIRNGHEVIALAHLKPPKIDNTQQDEIDSYMFQSVGHNVIEGIAEAMGLPLTQHAINGKPHNQGEIYVATKEDEVEDLYHLLSMVKQSHPDVQGVATGAILSTYQRIRVENVCSRLGFTSFCYLWRREEDQLLRDMIDSKMGAILIKTASMGLVPSKHLMKTIDQMYPILKVLNQKYGVNICGEGGEYESLVLDCPLFKKRIELIETEVIVHSDDAFVQVAYATFQKYKLVDKTPEEIEEGKKYLVEFAPSYQTSISTWNDKFSNFSIPISIEDYQIPTTYYTGANGTKALQDTSDLTRLEIIQSKSGFFHIKSFTILNDNLSSGETLDQILTNISEKLKSLSMTMENLVFVNLYLKDMNDFGIINQNYYKHFKENPSARACIQVGLPVPNCKVMVDCIGHQVVKKNLHVQSISNWAPACIGPYSQATFVDNLLLLAGQIGLEPGSIALIQGGVETELKQIFINLSSVFEALKNGFDQTLQCTVFIKDIKYSNLIYEYLMSIFTNSPVRVLPLITIAEIEHFPKSSNVEVLLLNDKIPDHSDEEFKRECYRTEKNFRVDSVIQGFNSIISNISNTTLFNFNLTSLDREMNLDTQLLPTISTFIESMIDSISSLTTVKDICENIISIKIYYDKLLSGYENEIYKVFKKLNLNQISLVKVNKLYHQIHLKDTTLMVADVLFHNK